MESDENFYPETSGQQYFSDVNTRLRDIEERQKLLKDRTLIMGKNLVEEREKSFAEIQEMKKGILNLKEDIVSIKQTIQSLTEHINKTARKEDFDILQRQLDILRS